MANYTKMARDAENRRKEVARLLAKARREVDACERELTVLTDVLAALKGTGSSGKSAIRRRGRGRKARRGGKWRPGRPGRPPEWWREKQAAMKGGKKKGRRGRRRRRAASAPAAAPATS